MPLLLFLYGSAKYSHNSLSTGRNLLRATHRRTYSFFTALRAPSFITIYTNTPTFHFHSLSRPWQNPSVDVIDEIFSHYQQERQGEVKPVWDSGYSMIRQVTPDSWLSWLWDWYVLRWVHMENFMKGIIPSLFLIRHGNILSYVPFVGEQESIAWLRRPIAKK
jgi:hypothetical protein